MVDNLHLGLVVSPHLLHGISSLDVFQKLVGSGKKQLVSQINRLLAGYPPGAYKPVNTLPPPKMLAKDSPPFLCNLIDSGK